MCDARIEGMIEDVVKQKADANEMFTVFEITLAVQVIQEAAGEPKSRNVDIKLDIHRVMFRGYVQPGVYERTLVDVGNGQQAFVYFPTGADPNEWEPLPLRSQASSGAGAVPAVPSVPGTVPAAPTADDDGDDDSATTDDADPNQSRGARRHTYCRPGQIRTNGSPDGRGTLTVPAGLMKQAGFQVGDTVWVESQRVHNAPALIVRKQKIDTGIARQYTVDRSWNIRITSFTLNKAGLKGKPYYEFTGSGRNVVIKELTTSIS